MSNYIYTHTGMHAQSLSHVWLFLTLWTVALWAPLSTGFSRQEYGSGLPFPIPEDLPNPGTAPASLASHALAGRFFTTAPPRKPTLITSHLIYFFWTLSPDNSASAAFHHAGLSPALSASGPWHLLFLPIFHLLHSCFGSWLKCHFCREDSPGPSTRETSLCLFFKCTYLSAVGLSCSALDPFDVVHGLGRCSTRAPEHRGSAVPPHVGS